MVILRLPNIIIKWSFLLSPINAYPSAEIIQISNMYIGLHWMISKNWCIYFVYINLPAISYLLFANYCLFIYFFIDVYLWNWFRWSLIAGRLPGRTDNEVKNYWNTHLKRKLLRKGIDPNNHRLGLIRPTKSFVSNNHSCKEVNSQADNFPVLNSSTSGPVSNISSFPDLNLDLTIGLPIM